MVQLDCMYTLGRPVGMHEQRRPSDHDIKEQWSSPGRMPDPPDPANELANGHGRGTSTLQLVEKNFLILPGECLHETQ